MKRLATILLICLFSLPCWAVHIWVDVDAAVTVPVNHIALSTDGTDIDAGVTYNEAGMVLVWNFMTTAGVQTQTAADPCNTGGNYDWVIVGNGIYNIEIPASGGEDFNNDTEGFGWFSGITTATLPWSGPMIGFRAAVKNNLEIDDGTAQQNQSDMYDGTGYAGGTILQNGNATQISGDATTADNQQVFYGNGTTFGLFADYYDGTTVSVAGVFSDAVTLSSLGTKVVADMDANSADFNTIIASTAVIGTAVALDGGAATIGGMLTKMADGNNGLDFVAGTDSLQEIGDRGDTDWITAVGFSTLVASDNIGINWADVTNPETSVRLEATVINYAIDPNSGSLSLSSADKDDIVDRTDANSTQLAAIVEDTAIIGPAVALDGGTQTITGMLTKMADDNDGADFDAGTDSLEKIRNRGDAAWTSGSSDAVTTTIASASSKQTVTLTAGKQVANAYLGMSLTVVDGDGPAGEATETRTIIGWSSGRIALLDKPFSFLPVATDVATIPQGNYFRPVRNP